MSSFYCLNLTLCLTSVCNAYLPGVHFPIEWLAELQPFLPSKVGSSIQAACLGTAARFATEDGHQECFSEAVNPPVLACFLNPILIMFALYFFMPFFFLKLLVLLSCPHQRALKGRGNSSKGVWEEGCCPCQTSYQPSIVFPAQSGIETATSVSHGIVSNPLHSPHLCNVTIYILREQKAHN